MLQVTNLESKTTDMVPFFIEKKPTSGSTAAQKASDAEAKVVEEDKQIPQNEDEAVDLGDVKLIEPEADEHSTELRDLQS
jgi:hypothetical protein